MAAVDERGREGDDAELRRWLERVVAERAASGKAIARVRRERFPHIGSYDCDALTVDLDDGEVLALFLKDFGYSRLSKDDRELRRDREMRVYRDLLAGAELGTPTYYGSLWDESRGRFWLLLERVDGSVVKEVDAESGIPAAAWLARLQGHFLRQADRLARCDFLIAHDAAFFRAKAEAARRDVARLSPPSAPRLAGVLERYAPAVDLMASQPLSLVHGGYIPWHILVGGRSDAERVCAIDWELAARGATLYDLAFFTDGVESPVRERIYRAYRDAAVEHGVPLASESEMQHVMDCFRLHRILDWLSRSVEKGFAQKKVAALVAQAEALGERVLH